MALIDRKIPIITGVNDVPSETGGASHPNASLLCQNYNALIDDLSSNISNKTIYINIDQTPSTNISFSISKSSEELWTTVIFGENTGDISILETTVNVGLLNVYIEEDINLLDTFVVTLDSTDFNVTGTFPLIFNTNNSSFTVLLVISSYLPKSNNVFNIFPNQLTTVIYLPNIYIPNFIQIGNESNSDYNLYVEGNNTLVEYQNLSLRFISDDSNGHTLTIVHSFDNTVPPFVLPIKYDNGDDNPFIFLNYLGYSSVTLLGNPVDLTLNP